VKIYERAQDLWPELIKQAGLDLVDRAPRWLRRDPKSDAYDAGLLDELRTKLFPGSTHSLQTSLKTAAPPVSAETLLRAFFQVLQPFAMMKLDILEMMAAARARKGDDNIKIRFQVNESDEPLDLLLNEFREQMEFIEKRIRPLSVREWSSGELWEILKVGETSLSKDFEPLAISPADDEIRKWVEQSRSTRRFETFPDVWRTGIDELDRRLKVVIDLTQEILTAFLRYGGDFAAVQRQLERIAEDGREQAAPVDPIGLTLRQLYFLESDFWLSAVGQWLLAVRHATARAASDEIVKTIVSELDNIIPRVRRSVAEREEIARKLTDILNLPIWKKRHAVYAVWIGSQIWQSLKPDWLFKFHLDKDVLSFAFSGVHLATLTGEGTDDILGWWTELRTPAANLPSGHRSKAIQPDYRVRRAPYSATDSDVLIVEVKQYRRSSTKNFSGALMDYAFACEKAAVMVTSYGPISPRVLEAVPDEYRKRTHTEAFIRPDRRDVCREFHDEMRRLIRSRDLVDSKPLKIASVEKVELKWGAHPKDLDLHLFSDRASPDGSHVYHGHKSFEQSIQLVTDIRDGHGPELLLFQQATGKHVLCVHQYSDDGALTTSGATVTIFADSQGTKQVASFECPNIGVGRWWMVCRFDFSAGVVDPINCLVEEPDVS
jgi:hypothetical protein